MTDANGGVDEVLASQLGGALITTATNIISSGNVGSPWGVTFDSSGNLFVVDDSGGVVYEVTASQPSRDPRPTCRRRSPPASTLPLT